jgi:hypothetical protein
MSQSKFKKASLLAGTALVAAGVMTAGTASADKHARIVSSGQDKTTLRLRGHVSRQITFVNDGESHRMRHSDSDFSSSRFILDAAGRINSDLRVRSRIETAVDDNRNTPAIHDAENGARTGDDLRTRIAEIVLDHKRFGRLSIGAGNTASNGVSETNFNNYTMLPGQVELTGRSTWRNEDGTTNTDTFENFGQRDGLGRSTRLRYDTPNIMGFMASAGHLDNQSWDAALRYSGRAFGTRIRAAISYANADISDNDIEIYDAGVALSHSSGFGASYGIEYQNDNSRSDNAATTGEGGTQADPFFQHATFSYTAKFNDLGTSQLVYEYVHAENKVAASNSTGNAHSIGFHQRIDAAAMEVAIRYSHMELETDGVEYKNDDIDHVSIHTRLRF